MYASLHVRSSGFSHLLLAVAHRFSPQVELTSEGRSVTFSIAPLRKMIGSPHQIASEICHAGHELKLQASLAIAANPDTALLLARHFIGVTMVTPGEERLKLAAIPLATIFEYQPVQLAPSLLEILLRWGVKTCEDISALPEKGIAERLGTAGVYLRNLACGTVHRPLRLKNDVTGYEMQMELEHSLSLLEPLLFLLGSAAGELCRRLRSQSQAARELKLHFHLDNKHLDNETEEEEKMEIEKPNSYQCRLEFPVPIDNSRTILKLLQLHLERHPPASPVKAFRLSFEPTDPQRVQAGIFLPATPAPDKLQVTLARIASMVGPQNVGTPELSNTHRPDAFTTKLLPAQQPGKPRPIAHDSVKPGMLRLAMRLFRPALHARVHVVQLAPRKVLAPGVHGHVTRYAGPWKTAGEWWTHTAWSREEWDVALDDGALYRIYQESATREWFVHAIYD